MNADELKNADEIVRALRDYASDCDDCGDCLRCDFACVCGEFDYNAPKIIADLIESLTAQLAASQRREKAAVEDLNGLARFEKERCAYCLHDEECEPGEMLCSYKGDKAFEWRGPQVGKGEADGN